MCCPHPVRCPALRKTRLAGSPAWRCPLSHWLFPSLASSLVLFAPLWSKNSIKTTCAPRLAPAFRRVSLLAATCCAMPLLRPLPFLAFALATLSAARSLLRSFSTCPAWAWPILSGIQSNYTMLVQGVVLVVAVTFIIINIVVDMLYILIDPRIRTV